MSFNPETLVKYTDRKVDGIDSAITKKESYLKTIQDKLDQHDTLLRRRNALSAIFKQLKEETGILNKEVRSVIYPIIRSLIFDIDSENVEAKKEYDTKRKNIVESEIQFLKKRKQEVIDIKNIYAGP